ncbi:MAG: PDGLE domain-containing protein, partial [Opitutales bacterium]|nr:PDGLE domain-containing protein [Opitutales bacterium]
ESTAIGLAAFASVELAVLAVCVELLASGKGNFSIFVTLLGVHTALAMCEGCATVALSSLIKKSETSGAKKGVFALSLLTIVALMISPFASAFPDGFEWTMKNFALLPDAPNFTNAPFIDYVVPAISNDVVSGVVAGFIGVFVTMLVSFGVAKILPTKA